MNTLIYNTKKYSRQSFANIVKNEYIWDVVTKTAKYYNYHPSDVITHVQYVNQTTLKKRKPKACPWQGKTRIGATVLHTHDWFERNIEYGQHDWYCTSVEMDKDITTDILGPCCVLPGIDSTTADATSIIIPNTVATKPT